MSFYSFLPKLINMSLTASVAIVLVILLRLLLKKAPYPYLIESSLTFGNLIPNHI